MLVEGELFIIERARDGATDLIYPLDTFGQVEDSCPPHRFSVVVSTELPLAPKRRKKKKHRGDGDGRELDEVVLSPW